MKTRKLVSLGLAAVMSLSLAAPSFAAGSQTVFESTYKAPDIKVTVPQKVSVALNPLGLDVALTPDEPDQIIKGQQIVTTPAVIVNNSTMDLNVGASIVTTIAGGDVKVKLSGTEPTGSSAKQAFVFFQMKATTLTDGTDKDIINVEAAKWAYDYSESTKAKCVILKMDDTDPTKSKEVTGENLVTLKAANEGEPVEGSIALMRLSGKLVKSPKPTKDADGNITADNSWKADDTVTATVTFTFDPA